MAFPSNPADQQTYTTSGGTTYQYFLSSNSWRIVNRNIDGDPNIVGPVLSDTVFPSDPEKNVVFWHAGEETLYVYLSDSDAWIEADHTTDIENINQQIGTLYDDVMLLHFRDDVGITVNDGYLFDSFSDESGVDVGNSAGQTYDSVKGAYNNAVNTTYTADANFALLSGGTVSGGSVQPSTGWSDAALSSYAPTAYWACDDASGGLADSSGNGLDLGEVGSPTYNGDSVTLDGSTDGFRDGSVSHSMFDLGGNDWTFKISVTFATVQQSCLFSSQTDGANRYSLLYLPSDSKLRIYDVATGTTIYSDVWGPSVGVEYCVVAYRSGNTVYFEVDGLSIGSGACGVSFQSHDKFAIGRRAVFEDFYLHGTIRDVALWNGSALDSSARTALAGGATWLAGLHSPEFLVCEDKSSDLWTLDATSNYHDMSTAAATVTGSPTIEYQYEQRTADPAGSDAATADGNITWNGSWLSLAELQTVADSLTDEHLALKVRMTPSDAGDSFDAFSIGTISDMVLVSNSFAAESEPTETRVNVFVEPLVSITPNTDLIVYASRDGGTTWDQATLSKVADLNNNIDQFVGDASLASTGTSMVLKLETANSKSVNVHAWGQRWR